MARVEKLKYLKIIKNKNPSYEDIPYH